MFIVQEEIGWRLFLDGCLAYQWATVQHIYCNWMGCRKTGNIWAAGLMQNVGDTIDCLVP